MEMTGDSRLRTARHRFTHSGLPKRCSSQDEISGLDPETNTIMEASCVITEADLSEVARVERIIVHQPSYVLNGL